MVDPFLEPQQTLSLFFDFNAACLPGDKGFAASHLQTLGSKVQQAGQGAEPGFCF
jgi:hypothetical protein